MLLGTILAYLNWFCDAVTSLRDTVCVVPTVHGMLALCLQPHVSSPSCRNINLP
jgi:hypothetical protein